jgi:hypothetical protein
VRGGYGRQRRHGAIAAVIAIFAQTAAAEDAACAGIRVWGRGRGRLRVRVRVRDRGRAG